MAAIKNTTIQQSNAGYYINGQFNGIEYDVSQFNYDLRPGEIACFALLTTGLGDAEFSNFWRELF